MPSSLVSLVSRCWEDWPRSLTAGGLVVGVSGGVDSVVLLDVLVSIARAREVSLIVAHAHHGLRGAEADADAAWVQQRAASLNLPCVVQRLDVRAERERAPGSLEMTARRLRHAFLARTAREAGAKAVALAHHGDDQVELFLLRLFRGSGGDGLGGMSAISPSTADSRITLVRPLLGTTRAEILEYARQHRLEFREDATNRDASIRRNHIRHVVLPWLRTQVGEHLDRAILRSAEIVRADAECVEELAGRWLKAAKPSAFPRLPLGVQRAVIRRQLWQLGSPVEFDLIERLRLTEVNQSVGGGITARSLKGRLLEISPAVEFDSESRNLIIKRPGRFEFAGLCVQWRLSKALKPSKPRPVDRSEIFDAKRVGDVITLRHWRPGDRFQPLGLARSSKLQNLFTNRKIPAATRRRLVVAATSDGTVFWVEGLPPGEAFKLTPATRTLLHWGWKRVDR